MFVRRRNEVGCFSTDVDMMGPGVSLTLRLNEGSLTSYSGRDGDNGSLGGGCKMLSPVGDDVGGRKVGLRQQQKGV